MNQRPFLHKCRRFIRDRRGVTAAMFAFALIVILGAAGVAIDMARTMNVENRMQHALDAAALAAATRTDDTTEQRIEYAKAVFAANFPSEPGSTVATPTFAVSAEGVVTGTVTASVERTLTKLFGDSQLNLRTTTEVYSDAVRGEIVLVLDYSGSMNWFMGEKKKYKLMRSAATKLIKRLTKQYAVRSVKFGLVPFSAHVYGTFPKQHIVNQSGSGDWTNCTMDRKSPYNTRDTTPVVGTDASKWGMTCAAHNPWCNPYSACGQYTSRKLVIRPLSDNHEETVEKLKAMRPLGKTHISLGLAMGWHLISANEPFVEGVPYQMEDYIKAIVLLTDGVQTSQGWGTGGSRSVANAEANLATLCTNIKADGVMLITVAYDLNDGSTLNRLRNCATSTDLAFQDIKSGKKLESVFSEIGTAIEGMMRIAK